MLCPRPMGDHRAILRRAKHLNREVPRLLHRHRRHLSHAVLWEIADGVRALRAALEAVEPDVALVGAWSGQVEGLVDQHVAVYDARDEIWDYAETLLAALLIALFIRTFLFEAFKIPSGSMIPTLMVDDHIFVSKFIYGVPVPFTDLTLFDWREPAHGEVVVFEYPGPGPEHGKDFIKRVVAVAGDTVRLEDNLVVVNGEVGAGTRVIANKAECLLTPEETCQWRPLNPEQPLVGRAARQARRLGCPCTFLLEAHGEDTWMTQHLWPDGECDCQTPSERQSNARNSAQWPDLSRHGAFLSGWGDGGAGARWTRKLGGGRIEMAVPEGYVFVMGDNRDNSKDGRYWGLVPLKAVRGKALFIWWAGADRWSRMFRLVH